MSSFPRWQLHRGYWKSGVRENTMQSFIAAKRLGAEMVELDVQLSKNKVPVVFHDLNLKRLFHIDQKVSQTSLEDLKTLNVPLLSQVLQSDEVPPYLNVELKIKTFFCYGLVRAVISELRKQKKKKILISSFNPICLLWVKLLEPKLPRALIIHDRTLLMGFMFKIYKFLSSPQYLNVNYKLIDEELPRARIIDQKLPVMVWTVNESDKARFYLERGAVSIISDELLKSNL